MIYEIKCKSCDRFLGTTDKSVEVTIKCSNSSCKILNEYKIVFMSDHISKPHVHYNKDIDGDK